MLLQDRLARTIVVAIVMSLAALPAAAQSNQQLLDRIGRLERDIQNLRVQLHSGGTATGSAAASGAATPASAANFEIRLQQMEREIRSLTGDVEEVNFRIRRLEEQFERSQSDIEMRLNTSGAMPTEGIAGPGGDVATGTSAPPAAESRSAGPTVVAGAPAAPTGRATTLLPRGAPAEDYNNAYALLLQADYAGAEQAFRGFLENHADDPLAGNAQYWLGETYYVREDYQQSAIHFAEGYQRYPEGPKAPANLLKLGMSLARLGKKNEACASFDELDRRFPDAPGNVQQYARTERQRIGCN